MNGARILPLESTYKFKLFSTRTSDRGHSAQIWHACADRYSHLKKKKLTHPTPWGFRGLFRCCSFVRTRVRSLFLGAGRTDGRTGRPDVDGPTYGRPPTAGRTDWCPSGRACRQAYAIDGSSARRARHDQIKLSLHLFDRWQHGSDWPQIFFDPPHPRGV